MADLVPTNPALAPRRDDGAPMLMRLRGLAAQPLVRRALPWFLGVAAIGGAGLTWAVLGPVPQRVLYSQLDDSERASVVAALDKGNVRYHIDNTTGVLTVDENDLYRARMLVAQNNALALPDSGADSLDKMPIGASRAVEDEHLLAAREHELELSIKEIDGVKAVRVHIAQGTQSVFVRDTLPPSASVMLRLADGRQLAGSQVAGIVNLVAGSVPGLGTDAVRVVDQHGHLLSEHTSGDSDRIELQSRLESKLAGQVGQLLAPMLGEGNFSAEVQVDLDLDQVTSARESYDKTGALRSETQAASNAAGQAAAIGVPGVIANTPPPATTAAPGAPQGSPASPAPGATPGATPGAAPSPGASPGANPNASATTLPAGGESSASRMWELGRDVSVSNQAPGRIKRLSVAVALSAAAMAKFKPVDIDQIKSLITAAVGADPARGDTIAVVVRKFDTPPPVVTPFYEASWFAPALHNGVALLGLVLVLMFGVRPLLKVLRRPPAPPPAPPSSEPETLQPIAEITDPVTGAIDAEALSRQVSIAQRLVASRPDDAAIALKQMLRPNEGGA